MRSTPTGLQFAPQAGAYDSVGPVADLLQRQLGFSDTQIGTSTNFSISIFTPTNVRTADRPSFR